MALGERQYGEQDDLVYNGGPITVASGSQRITPASAVGVRASGLALAGVITILLGIWGGIVPFLGPTFGYSADGAVSWNMTSAHLWLAVIPGAVGFVAGLVMLLVAPRTVTGSGRSSLLLAGLLAVLAGAWFILGPLSWPVITTATHYFVSARPLRELEYQVGYGLGTGALLVLTGSFAVGWCARHQQASPTVVLSRRRGAHSAVPGPAVVAEPVVPVTAPTMSPTYVAPPTTVQPVASTSQPVVSDIPTTTRPVVIEEPVDTEREVVTGHTAVTDPVVAE